MHCHPFSIQGMATMTNGKENTDLRPHQGISHVASGSLVTSVIIGFGRRLPIYCITRFNHWLLGLPMYKHVITPLMDGERRCNSRWSMAAQFKKDLSSLDNRWSQLRYGLSADKTLFMVQDSKKLRPGVAGAIRDVCLFLLKCVGWMLRYQPAIKAGIFNQ